MIPLRFDFYPGVLVILLLLFTSCFVFISWIDALQFPTFQSARAKNHSGAYSDFPLVPHLITGFSQLVWSYDCSSTVIITILEERNPYDLPTAEEITSLFVYNPVNKCPFPCNTISILCQIIYKQERAFLFYLSLTGFIGKSIQNNKI